MTYQYYKNGELATKSNERVKKFGEVYTPRHVIVDMVDMLEKESGPLAIDATVLDPCCGATAGFGVEIFRRKMEHVEDSDNFLRLSLYALASTFSVDIQNDNVVEARESFLQAYWKILEERGETNGVVEEYAYHIITWNVVQGDFLTGLTSIGTPVYFPIWTKSTTTTDYFPSEIRYERLRSEEDTQQELARRAKKRRT